MTGQEIFTQSFMFWFWRIPFVSSQHIHFRACVCFNNLECYSLCPLASITMGFSNPQGRFMLLAEWLLSESSARDVLFQEWHIAFVMTLPNRGGWEVRGSPYPGKNSFFVFLKKKTQMMNSLIWGLWVGETLQWSHPQCSLIRRDYEFNEQRNSDKS